MLKTRSTIVLFPFLLLIIHCGGNHDIDATNGIMEKATNVKVSELSPQEFVEFIELTGTVKADVTSTISAEESGVIQRFLKEKGDWVGKDETVVELKSDVLKASYEEAKASYLLSKATFERQANLYKDNVISEQKYLEYKFTYERDKARYENLKSRLDKTTIASPVSGEIDQRLAEVGEYVMPGMPLFRIVKTDLVKIAAGVPEKYITDVKKGSRAILTFDVLPDTQLEGTVSFVGPTITPSTRTFPIEITIANKDGLLKPEMFVDIKLKKAEHDRVVVIPRDAVIETEAGEFVFVAQGNVAEKRPVTIGGAYNNNVWISDGLNVGDALIVVGHRDLADGERIAVHE